MNNKDLIAQYVDTGLRLPEEQVVQLPTWARKTYIRKRIIAAKQSNDGLEEYEFDLMDTMDKWNYFISNKNNNAPVRDKFFQKLPDDLKYKLVKIYIDEGNNHLTDMMFSYATDDLKVKWVKVCLIKGRGIESYVDLILSNQELKDVYVNALCSHYLKYSRWVILNYVIFKALDDKAKFKIVNTILKTNPKGMLYNIWDNISEELRVYFLNKLGYSDRIIDNNFYFDNIQGNDKYITIYLNGLVKHLKMRAGSEWFLYMDEDKLDEYKRLNNGEI